ncbi:NADH:flavin oxidoreductase/NADH oxidase [Pararhodobacter sp.]|uniref:NADH:flavin oxidoreductase/NADH oxidase n=1 Tax=Pararhodobacter sp. TaxID=2127056 RepID=UPI002FDD8382
MTSPLFEPFTLRNLRLDNRVVVSPMQTYCAPDAIAGAWHRTHLARFALGGAGLVMVEATAVSPEGRSTNMDLGLWEEEHAQAFADLTKAVHECGARIGIQLQHAGRKASTAPPWRGFAPVPAPQGQAVIGPSDKPASSGAHVPRQMDADDMARLIDAYSASTRMAACAGFDLVEIHMAHGYLLHSFLSPLSNDRTDDYGGALENRMRFPLRVVEAVRTHWAPDKPLACRISSVDGVSVGWSIADSRILADRLRRIGVDLIDCSSGGMILPERDMLVPRGPGFQVDFAADLRGHTGLATIAVGQITDAAQANDIIASGRADLVAIGRQMLVNPNWALEAETALSADHSYDHWPRQFGWWLGRRRHATDTR